MAPVGRVSQGSPAAGWSVVTKPRFKNDLEGRRFGGWVALPSGRSAQALGQSDQLVVVVSVPSVWKRAVRHAVRAAAQTTGLPGVPPTRTGGCANATSPPNQNAAEGVWRRSRRRPDPYRIRRGSQGHAHVGRGAAPEDQTADPRVTP